MTKEQLNIIRLIQELAADINTEKPNFKTTLDGIEHHVQWLKKSLGIDKCLQDCTQTFDGTDSRYICNVEFIRKDLNCISTCGRNRGHKGEHSWYNDSALHYAQR